MKPNWERVQEIFLAALDHQSETRTAFVRGKSEDTSTFREVAALLRSHDEAGKFIEKSPLPLTASGFLNSLQELQPGQSIGHYTIHSLLGSGGMGEVYLAQDTQLGREVAIKVVKRGFANAEILRQFQREERILAALNHPYIARLYGGAITAEGVPYFVMEYVAGERLDKYCDEHGLNLRQRLELFRKVCGAVSYAHQRLIIHRDLKPANIRVTSDGEPKLLDFGIAKLLQREPEQLQTITMAPVMTPDYASPEQTRGETMTTATDIYSLGVILYQLLTGRKPHPNTGRTPEEVVHAIREQDPARPSQVQTNPRLAHLLRGDLDNIMLMALRKEPGRRYPTVQRFSEDIRRYLEGRPIFARKDTIGYRASKFIRRNRIAVSAAMLILLSLLGGIIATSWESRKARLERNKAQNVNEFLEQMIAYSNPYLGGPSENGRATTMNEMLDAAARRLQGDDFARQPALKAELERIIGASYYGQGNTRLGNEHTQRYVSLATKLYSADDPRLLPALAARAGLLFGGGNVRASEQLYRQLLPRLRDGFAKNRVKVTDFADALVNFGYLRRTQGDSHEAELLFREMLALSPKLPVESRFIVEVHRGTLASTLADEGKFNEAVATARQAVAEAQAAGRSDTPGYGFCLTVLAGLVTELGNYSEADAKLSEAESIFRRFLGPAHLWLGDNLRNQAISCYRQRRFGEAELKNAEALRIYRQSFGPHYDQYPTVLVTEGLILDKTSRSREAEPILREALRLRTDSLPKEHFWIGLAQGALGECLAHQKRMDEAEPLLATSYHIVERALGAHDPRTRAAREKLIAFYESIGKTEDAARLRATF